MSKLSPRTSNLCLFGSKPLLYLVTSPLPPVKRSPFALSVLSRAPRGLLHITHIFLALSGLCDQTPARWFSPGKCVGTWEGWKCGGLSQSCTRGQSKPVQPESLRGRARHGSQVRRMCAEVTDRSMHLPGVLREAERFFSQPFGWHTCTVTFM